MTSDTIVPPFYFPKGENTSTKLEQSILNTICKVRKLFNYRLSLTEQQFIPISEACGIPRYLNMAFFRKLEWIGNTEMNVTLSTFIDGWTNIVRESKSDKETLFFNILKKSNSRYVIPEDFLPVLEDVVFNHPGLSFLNDKPIFLERYIETVICRIFYDANCSTGRMSLSQFKKTKFVQMIINLGPNIDLNDTRDCFSYKHFYVLYCKFWVLDEDRDFFISENDLLNYNDGVLSPKIIRQVMKNGHIPAFAKKKFGSLSLGQCDLTYIDYIWFIISETDKSTDTAIEFWFKCLDEDSDGIITTFDLAEHWKDQDKQLRDISEYYNEECILFDDLIRQMNDLIQPIMPGQFRLSDLKRNGIIAERFFDTFLNIEKFQIHDTYQGLIRSIHQLEKERRAQELEGQKMLELQRQLQRSIEEASSDRLVEIDLHSEGEEKEEDLEKGYAGDEELGEQGLEQKVCVQQYHQPFSVGPWCDYAEQEYNMLVLSEQCESESSEWSLKEEERNTTEVEEDFHAESPTSSTTSDELESDSSAPSTPVMQDPVIHTEKWTKCNEDNSPRTQLGVLSANETFTS